MMDELTWIEYKERIRKGAPVLVIAGATEQHGPHLPLGTDVFQVLDIARKVAERTNGIVAPPIIYGYKSQPKGGGGQSFVGTTSLDGHTLTLIVRDLVREFLRHDVRHLVFIDGHYGNAPFMTEGIDLALRGASVCNTKILLLRWFELIPENTLDEIFEGKYPGLRLEHAAVIETSVMGVVRPDLVRWDRLVDDQAKRVVPYEIYPAPAEIIARSGVLSPAGRASAEIGVRIVSEVVGIITKIVQAECQF
jgi:creatinine amidohydrolase